MMTSYIKVEWDEPATIARPGRVSPWEIEPLAPPAPENKSLSASVMNRMIWPANTSSSGNTLPHISSSYGLINLFDDLAL